MIASALGSNNGDVERIQRASRNFDRWTQLNSMAFMHAMRSPSQSAAQAKTQTDAFVGFAMNNAITLQARGDHDGAMWELGMAMHAVMDATSPAHRDGQGNPKPWDMFGGIGPIRAHNSEESGGPSAATRREMDEKLRDMYNKVMSAKKGGT
jgi:hypothetical protein